MVANYLEQKKIKYLLLILLIMLAVGGTMWFSDYLGARLITKGSPRLNVRQGETVTLQLKNVAQTRKLELCTEKKNIVLGYSDFSNCYTLQHTVEQGVSMVPITVPSNFPLGRAVVITRLRSSNGLLVPAAPSDEKIALMVIPTQKSVSKPTTPSVTQNEEANRPSSPSNTSPKNTSAEPKLPAGFSACDADVNNDGYVSVTDLANISSRLGQTGSNLIWDLNQDGVITDADMNLASSVIPSTCTPPATPTPDINICRDGDMNSDGVISVTDLANISSRVGQTGSNLAGDINHDGAITSADLDLVSAAITTTCPN